MPNITPHHEQEFDEIHQMILEAHIRGMRSINTTLIQLYWSVGEYVSLKTKNAGWGKNTVESLAEYIGSKNLPRKGFSSRNIWRMKQFKFRKQ